MEYGETVNLPISQNIIKQMSYATIKYLIDALVELIANSDDSYKRLEYDGISGNGTINIQIYRKKGGACDNIEVKDFAEGMDRPNLLKANTFAEPASGIEKGKSVRGFFGRGLKEAIISLGKGRIETIKDNVYDSAEVWWDDNKKSAQCRLLKEPILASDKLRNGCGILHGNGTRVRIDVRNDKIKCPDYKTFKEQLSKHYALRDINSNAKIKVWLVFNDWKGVTSSKQISYSPPKSTFVTKYKLALPIFNDQAEIRVFESSEELDSPKANPFAQAGFLIKTEGAILDIQLFKYENEKAGLYFFGEVICPGIAKLLTNGEQGLIDPNRAGLDWKHTYCTALRKDVEEFLAPYIEKKKKEIEKKPAEPVPEKTKKILGNLCSLLNKLAKEELEPFNPLEVGLNIHEFMIKPEFANLQIGLTRLFSVYIPQDLWPLLDKGESINLTSTNPNIQIVDSVIKSSELSHHPKHSDLLYGRFGVVGNVDGEEATLTCKVGEHLAWTHVKVAEPKDGGKKRTLSGKRLGFFSRIEPDENENPLQRVQYDRDSAEVRIFIKFPAVKIYLGSGLKGMETVEGKIVLAELVGDAFCREIARRRIEIGKDPIIPGSEIDTFNSVINELQRKYLHHIHKVIIG